MILCQQRGRVMAHYFCAVTLNGFFFFYFNRLYYPPVGQVLRPIILIGQTTRVYLYELAQWRINRRDALSRSFWKESIFSLIYLLKFVISSKFTSKYAHLPLHAHTCSCMQTPTQWRRIYSTHIAFKGGILSQSISVSIMNFDVWFKM